MKLVEKFKNLFRNKILKVNYDVLGASIYLNWKPVKSAEYYKILRKVKQGFVEYCITYEHNARLDFFPVGITELIVQAYSKNKLISQSEEFQMRIENLEVNYAVDNERVLFFWNKLGGVDGYKFYKKNPNGVYSNLLETEKDYMFLYGLPQTCDLKLKPFRNVNGEKVYKKLFAKFSVDKSKKDTAPDKVFGLIATVEKSNVQIKWKPVKDADNYKIYLKYGDEFQEISQTENNYCLIKHLPIGKFYIGVRAFKNDECIANSYLIKTEIKTLEVFAINENKKVFLYWNKLDNIDGYRIYKKNLKGEFVGFVNTKNEFIYLDNVKLGEKCEFKVKPFKIVDGEREFTKFNGKCKVKVYSTQEIKAVVNEAYGDKIAISWLFDGDLDGFEIYQDNELIEKIDDGLAHITLLDYSEKQFVVKGYKIYHDKIVYTCESKPTSLGDKNSRLSLPVPKKYKVSVIIPAYNSQDYISRSISTVLGSDMHEVQLVVVDDGSSDNTADIINWYAEKYPNYIKALFKKNGGVADTRNKGIEAADGECIAFMDNDDMMRPHGYSTLYNALKKTKSDIAIAPLYRIDSDQYVPRHVLKFEEHKAHNIDDYLKLIYSDKYNNIGVWNKLYKANLVKEHPFGILAYEDVSWTPYILSYADKFCYIHKICYEWDRKIRPETFSNVLSNRSAEEKFKERYEAFRFFLDNGNPKRKECLYYIMAKRLYNQGKTAKYEGYFNAIRDMKENLINNKYLLEDKIYFEKLSPYLT